MSDAAQVTPQGQATPPQSTDARGIPDAVLRIQSIINSEDGVSPAKRGEAQQPAPQEQVPAQPDATQETEAPAGPNKQVEADEATPADAQGAAEIPLDQLEAIMLDVTVKDESGNDVTEKVSIKELRHGRMRDADYRRKTAEVARQKEQLREETRKAVDTTRAEYLKELQTMHDLVMQTAESELAGVDMNALARDNAFEYVRLDNRQKQINKTLEAIKGKQQEVLSKHAQESQAAMREAAAKARTKLEADIPGFNDALYSQLMKAGIERYGYKQEEVSSWVDPRAFILLHKANLYDQGQTQKSAPPSDKKVVVPPKVVKPGVVRDVSQQAQREQAAMKQLRGSGQIQDAAAVIKSRFG